MRSRQEMGSSIDRDKLCRGGVDKQLDFLLGVGDAIYDVVGALVRDRID